MPPRSANSADLEDEPFVASCCMAEDNIPGSCQEGDDFMLAVSFIEMKDDQRKVGRYFSRISHEIRTTISLTAVFVTHDQHEAFALADRVAVLQQGRLQQVDSPEALFHTPATPAIADFVDAGTLLDGRLDAAVIGSRVSAMARPQASSRPARRVPASTKSAMAGGAGGGRSASGEATCCRGPCRSTSP